MVLASLRQEEGILPKPQMGRETGQDEQDSQEGVALARPVDPVKVLEACISGWAHRKRGMAVHGADIGMDSLPSPLPHTQRRKRTSNHLCSHSSTSSPCSHLELKAELQISLLY